MSRSEATAALIGATLLAGGGIWLLLRWFATAPPNPDPWNEEVAAELDRDDCPQVCQRCLTPQDRAADFCSHCGAMVGPYTCLVPPLYLFSIGEVFRAAAEGSYRRSSWLVVSFFLAGFTYLCWIPFPISGLALILFWGKILKNVPPNQPLVDDENPPPANSQ